MMNRDDLMKLVSENGARTVVPVRVPGGETLYVRELTLAERDQIDVLTMSFPKHARPFRAAIITYCLCDESGEALFKPHEVKEVQKLPSRIMTPVFDKANELNQIVATELEEIKADFSDAPAGDSSTG